PRHFLNGFANRNDVPFIDLAEEKQGDVQALGIDPFHFRAGPREVLAQRGSPLANVVADLDADEASNACHDYQRLVLMRMEGPDSDCPQPESIVRRVTAKRMRARNMG